MSIQTRRYAELEEFFNYLTKDYTMNEYVEIRLVVHDVRMYNVVKNWLNLPKVKNRIYSKNSCQLFFKKNQFDLLRKLLVYRSNAISRMSKVCYTLNPRVMVDGKIEISGYNNMKTVHFIFFDIELETHTAPSITEKKLLLDFVHDVSNTLKAFGLDRGTLVDSGNGYHLLYKLKPTLITDGKKEYYKQFIETTCEYFKEKYNGVFKIDKLKDFTRIFALPETLNPRTNTRVMVIEKNYDINTKYRLKSLKKSNINTEAFVAGDYKDKHVENSLVWNILLKGAPQGERHSHLIFALKLFLKAIGNTNFRTYEAIINKIYGGNCNLDFKDCADKNYSKGIVINWCKRNEEWCKKNMPDWADNKYV